VNPTHARAPAPIFAGGRVHGSIRRCISTTSHRSARVHAGGRATWCRRRGCGSARCSVRVFDSRILAAFIRQQERLFGCGQTTVSRNSFQNQLGPAVSIPTVFRPREIERRHRPSFAKGDTCSLPCEHDTVGQHPSPTGSATIPTGGNALGVGMLEARVRSPSFRDLLTWRSGVDAGVRWWNVAKWDRPSRPRCVSHQASRALRYAGPACCVWTSLKQSVSATVGRAYLRPAFRRTRRALLRESAEHPRSDEGRASDVVAAAAGVCPGTFQPSAAVAWFSAGVRAHLVRVLALGRRRLGVLLRARSR